MKLKIFKKVAAVFCAAIMTTSAFGMSASAAPTNYHGSLATSHEEYNSFYEKFSSIYNEISSKNVSESIDLESQKEAVLKYLIDINFMLVEQYEKGYTVPEDTVYADLHNQLDNLSNIINTYSVNDQECVTILYDQVSIFYDDGNINEIMAEKLTQPRHITNPQTTLQLTLSELHSQYNPVNINVLTY